MIKSYHHGSTVLVLSLVIFTLFISKTDLLAQNTVGIGTASPNTNTVLDLVTPSGNQGILLPRVTTLQRQAMAGALGSAENGLIVFDSDLNLFYHWVNSAWVVGLGSFSNTAGGDLQGTYPDPTLRDDVVTSSKIQDGSLGTPDFADNVVTAQKLNSEGNTDAILGTDAAGNPQWEPKANFIGNSLADGTILVGDASNTAQSQTISGDISLANDGTATINDNTITSNKIVDNTISAADIGTDAVTADEIAASAVTTDEILDGTINTIDLADNAVTGNKILDATITGADIGTDAVGSDEISSGAVGSDEIADGGILNADMSADAVNSSTIADGSVITDDIASGGNNKVLITTAAGTVFWENISLFETSTLAEGNIFVGDVTNTAAPLNARGSGRILIGDGTSLQSLNLTGDIGLSFNGDAQINTGVVGSPEVSDNSLTIDDIGPNAVEASELADNSVDTGALQDDAVATSKLQDGSVSTIKILDNAINSAKINDGTIATSDLADDAVNTAKIDGESNNNAVLTTDGSGDPQWESRNNFGTSSLPNANIFVGDGAGVSQARPVTGDVTISNTGNVQINTDAVGTNEVTDNSLTVDDIGPNAIEASELADNAVDVGAIQSNAVSTAKIVDDAVTVAKIDGAGNTNAMLTTDGAGNPQWEAKSTLDTDDTNELNTAANLTGTDLNITDAGGTLTVDLTSLVDDADADPANEIQDLSLAGNTLSLTNDASTVDLSGYLDNTDAQDLSNVLGQGNDAGGSSIVNVADPTGAQDVATKNYVDTQSVDDADADPTNELNTGANLTGTTLNIIDAGGTLPIDLSSLIDDADADSSNEIQDLSIAGNTLSLSGDATPVDLSGYLDNTDAQDLSNVLGLGNDAGGTAIVNVADPTAAQDVATKNYVDTQSVDDADADPTNEIQDLSLAGNTLSLSGDATTVDLAGYLDNTDVQDLSLAGNTLSLTNDASTVDLSGYLDNTDAQDLSNVLGQGNDAGGAAIVNVADPTAAQDVATKNYVDTQSVDDADADPTNEIQDLSLAGNTLSLSGDATTVDLAGYLDNTDVQDLSLAGNTLSLTNDASTVNLAPYLDNTDAQDLGNVLTQGNNAGGNTIANLANPTAAQQAATKSYVDSRSVDDADADPNNEIQDLDAVLTQGNDAGGAAIVNAADPTAAQDVATKNYVDGQVNLYDELSDLNDVDLTGLVDGQVLKWNLTNSQWEPANDATSPGPTTSYYAIDVSDFQGSENSILDVRLSGADGIAAYLRGPTSVGDLIAPINLPHGAEITDVTVYYHDSDGTDDLNIWVYRQAFGGIAVNTVASGSSSGTPGDTNISITPVSMALGTIDNNGYTYKLRIELGYYNTSTFASILNKVYGVKITYTN